MKTIAMLFAAVMIFAGCSARQEEMMSDVESNVSSVLEPSRPNSSQIEESRSEVSSESSVISESDPMLGEESNPTVGKESDSTVR